MFPLNTEYGRYLERKFESENKKERGKIDKIQKHYKFSLLSLEKINDKHTLHICIDSILDYHVKWADQKFSDKEIVKSLRKLFLDERKRFMQNKGMSKYDFETRPCRKIGGDNE